MQRYNQRMVEQLKVRQQQERARLPKIQRSEGKTRMAMYKKSLHINGAGSASEQREKIKQVGAQRRPVAPEPHGHGGLEDTSCSTGSWRGAGHTLISPPALLRRKPGPVPVRTLGLSPCSFLCW